MAVRITETYMYMVTLRPANIESPRFGCVPLHVQIQFNKHQT